MVEGPQDGVHHALDEEGFEEAKEDVVFLHEADDGILPASMPDTVCVMWSDEERGKEKGKRENEEMRG